MSIRVAGVTILVPSDAHVEKSIELDKLFDELGAAGEKRSDVLLLLEYRGVKLSVIIEETDVPEPKDLERLRLMEERLAEIPGWSKETIIVKIVRHKGIRRGKNLLRSMARSYRVELVECKSSIDLTPILARVTR